MTNPELFVAPPASPADVSLPLSTASAPTAKSPPPPQDFSSLITRAGKDLADKSDKSDSPGKSAKTSSDSDGTDATQTDPSSNTALLAFIAQAFSGTVVPTQQSVGVPLSAGSEASGQCAESAGSIKNSESSPAGPQANASKSVKTELGAMMRPVTPVAVPTEKLAASPSSNIPANSEAKAATANAKDAESSPSGNSAPVADSAPPNGKSAAAHLQTAVEKDVAARIKTAEPSVSAGGTGVASNSQRMNLADEKNEIAAATVQKMPRAARNQADPAESAAGLGNSSAAAVSASKKEESAPAVVSNSFIAPAPASVTTQSRGVAEAQHVDHAAAQVERVAQLVTREVMMVRQSGATTLVSLKPDSHTELFLQLTNQDGQVQASLRCMRGDVSNLDSHWGDLQQSLARQNVQLLPMENKTAPTFNSSANFDFNQSSHNPARRGWEWDEEPVWSAPVARMNTLADAKPKTKALALQGWESWA